MDSIYEGKFVWNISFLDVPKEFLDKFWSDTSKIFESKRDFTNYTNFRKGTNGINKNSKHH